MARRTKGEADPALVAVHTGFALACRHPMLSQIGQQVELCRRPVEELPADGWAVVDAVDGIVWVHPTRLAEPEQWAWVFAHLMLHLGFGHDRTDMHFRDAAASAAADTVVCRFQQSIKLGRDPLDVAASWPSGDETGLADRWRRSGVPTQYTRAGVAGPAACVFRSAHRSPYLDPIDWPRAFAAGLTRAVSVALDRAGSSGRTADDPVRRPQRPWERARAWFLSAYPLLGSTMATLTVVADADLCRGWDIAVAAVNPSAGELYINPLANFGEHEWRFILAHEALHAALNHHGRAGGRDHYLFNLAADFVINGWLVEMGVGELPDGLLLDAQFTGMSTEEVYDVIASQARRYRKLATLRGRDKPDVVGPRELPPRGGGAVDLDEVLRRSLASGLDLHVNGARGTLPAALVQEIKALDEPAPRWDVELARWFEEHFPTLEPVQSYARPSRRQSATPGIPRPGWYTPEVPVTRRTFGVVLDTSLSMDAPLLGKALGAVASYAGSHDVPAARVVFCDAAAYDAGYLDADDIAGRVRVRGRGGTVLQPGVDLLERAPDFPPDGPILIITDGWIDVLRVRREHAFLIPAGASLPFRPRGPVFRFS